MGKYKAPPVNGEINVTPMADVMLVLLIIFMVITPMLQKGISVDLAQTKNPRTMPDADKEDAVLLAVTRDGRIFLGTGLIKAEEITTRVDEMIAQKLDKTVYVKSDARAKYGDVVKVVDIVRNVGVDHLGLLTERIEQATGPASFGAAAPTTTP
jgi:biopolymer transport protein ExbD/biopolymer transport protein TolR